MKLGLIYHHLRVSVIGGTGDVTIKNNFLITTLTPTLTLCPYTYLKNWMEFVKWERVCEENLS